MQLSMFDQSNEARGKVPTMIAREVSRDYIAIRFRQIGRPQKFNIILSRFRYDFPLANCQEIEGQLWWIVTVAQYSIVEEFAKRNGLQLIKE